MKKDRIFISGKVSGTDLEQTRIKFAWAELDLEWNNHIETINPMDFGLTFKDSWLKCMVVSVWKLLKCRSIFMLTDWSKSRGARIEHFIARVLRYHIIYQK